MAPKPDVPAFLPLCKQLEPDQGKSLAQPNPALPGDGEDHQRGSPTIPSADLRDAIQATGLEVQPGCRDRGYAFQLGRIDCAFSPSTVPRYGHWLAIITDQVRPSGTPDSFHRFIPVRKRPRSKSRATTLRNSPKTLRNASACSGLLNGHSGWV